MTGAGILAMAHAGLHDTPETKLAAETLGRFSFTSYGRNDRDLDLDRYHYSLFQCTKASLSVGRRTLGEILSADVPHAGR